MHDSYVAYIGMACDHGLGTCVIILAYMVMVMAGEHGSYGLCIYGL